MSAPCYYLMRDKIILRLEEPKENHHALNLINQNILNEDESIVLNQDQANYRVAIFRDEILEWDEFQERL